MIAVASGATYTPKVATCPVCRGALHVNGEPCHNCGGQKMMRIPTGQTRTRADGTPCVHEFVGREAGRCYRWFTCVHCGERYDEDSGD